jgi:hypothetical protein
MCGCRQSGGSGLSPDARTGADAPAVAAAATVALQYRGVRALLIRGPGTGAGYACHPGETIRVHARDATHFIASGAFARVTR